MTQSPPPGWYQDPQDAGLQRYWNGTAWTDQTQPAAAPPPPPPPAATPPWGPQGVLPPATAKQGKAQARADRAYRKASRPWPLRHPIFTGLAVVVLIVIIAVASSGGGSSPNTAGSNPGDETAGKVLQHSEDVQIIKCKRDQFGDLDAKVKITNNSSKASDYIVTVAFETKDGSQQIDTGTAIIDSLQPGQSSVQDAGGLKSYKKPFKCVLSDAERTASF